MEYHDSPPRESSLSSSLPEMLAILHVPESQKPLARAACALGHAGFGNLRFVNAKSIYFRSVIQRLIADGIGQSYQRRDESKWR